MIALLLTIENIVSLPAATVLQKLLEVGHSVGVLQSPSTQV